MPEIPAQANTRWMFGFMITRWIRGRHEWETMTGQRYLAAWTDMSTVLGPVEEALDKLPQNPMPLAVITRRPLVGPGSVERMALAIKSDGELHLFDNPRTIERVLGEGLPELPPEWQSSDRPSADPNVTTHPPSRHCPVG